jgi:hypothetical protein
MAKRALSPADVAYERVREICLGFPGADEKLSHGAPSFHVRGKMFLTFVDSHHGDGRLAVWCKSTADEQRRLVAENPLRFFVPPYVGVKGWLGVCVDAQNADWIELSILVEEGWRLIAPPRLVRGEEVVAPRARVPPSPRVTTNPNVAMSALERLEAICLSLPAAESERESRHATFRVKKKAFAYFLDNHHGDGVIAACLRGSKKDNAALVKKDPKRFFSPAYIGPRGWVGMRLDLPRVDWKDVERRVTASYECVARPRAQPPVARPRAQPSGARARR